MTTRARLMAIHAAIAANAEVDVVVVQTEEGDLVVRWGVADVAMLQCTPSDARDVGTAFEADPNYAFVGRMLLEAADHCDAHKAVLH